MPVSGNAARGIPQEMRLPSYRLSLRDCDANDYVALTLRSPPRERQTQFYEIGNKLLRGAVGEEQRVLCARRALGISAAPRRFVIKESLEIDLNNS